MPELPDVVLYVRSLGRLLAGQRLRSIIVRSPFVLRTFEPPIESLEGQFITRFSRRGKRIVWEFSGMTYLVFHLMIAGRFHWRPIQVRPRGKNELAAFQFDEGTMLLTEASTKKRAGIWCLASQAEVNALDPGGIDVLASDDTMLRQMLLRTNNTLKRALVDPRRFDGIGNAYSDEILHAAMVSPLKRTWQLNDEEIARLCSAMRSTLLTWIDRLEFQNAGNVFPERITAFRPEMAVHGRFGQGCPVCGTTIQRIRYAENECNYCPNCQTGGRVLADRSLSRLLRNDWPRSLADLDDLTNQE